MRYRGGEQPEGVLADKRVERRDVELGVGGADVHDAESVGGMMRML
jgi:hypothetical protein